MSANRNDIAELARRMGDNCLVLGQQLSAWCGHAPALEEDIALANTALDLIGQTRLWYGLACNIANDGSTPDTLAYLRDGREFRNFLLVEYPNDDYAVTLMRQFLFDVWHYCALDTLSNSSCSDVSEIASKSIREVEYHRQRSTDLVVRLGDGSEQSHQKMQSALNLLWRLIGELTEQNTFDQDLDNTGIAPGLTSIDKPLARHLDAKLKEARLIVPNDVSMRSGGRDGLHSEAFGFLIAEMQSLHRSHPQAVW